MANVIHTANSQESYAAAVARQVKNGGKILAVGGGFSKLPPRYQEHPLLEIWDPKVHPGLLHKTIPSNIRAVVVGTTISHALFNQLHATAIARLLTFFPLNRGGSLRVALSGLFHDEAVMDMAEVESPPEPRTPWLTPETTSVETPVIEEPLMRKSKRGEQQAILAQEHQEGRSVTAESRRLLPIFKAKYQITTTAGSLAQGVRLFRKKAGTYKPLGKGRTPDAPSAPHQAVSGAKDVLQILLDQKDALDIAIDYITKQEGIIAQAAPALALIAQIQAGLGKK